MDRRQIAHVLEECATLLELRGENPFRCNAYRNAARAILGIEGNIEERATAGRLAEIKGIGKTMAEKISELVQTGTLDFHIRLKREIPPGLVEMLRINGFGPKRIYQAYDELGIDSIAKLRSACDDGSLRELKGFGKKLVENIAEGIEFIDQTGRRVLLPVAQRLADRMVESLSDHPAVLRLAVCGSLRRRAETVKDIDILVASSNPDPIMRQFVEHEDVIKVLGHGPTKSSVLLGSGIPADLRVVTQEQFPFALHYFTGSKAHNVRMRALAQAHGLKLNEYELAGAKKSVDCPEEADIFAALGLDYVPPELREDTGEIEAATDHQLPKLIESADIVGVFHCHTTASDGSASLEEMALAAQAAGYKYLGFADHSKSAFYANGLDAARVREQQRQIDELNGRLTGIRLFKGIESDILADGALDYDDDVLDSFDYIVASVHMPFKMTAEAMTARVLKAIAHPKCTMLGHPTGRLLLQRDSYPIDMEQVLRAAAAEDVLIEINANPHRLDVDWRLAKQAKAVGAQLVINPDAHSTEGFGDMEYGVSTARRGWLEPGDVFNTRSARDVERRLEERRGG